MVLGESLVSSPFSLFYPTVNGIRVLFVPWCAKSIPFLRLFFSFSTDCGVTEQWGQWRPPFLFSFHSLWMVAEICKVPFLVAVCVTCSFPVPFFIPQCKIVRIFPFFSFFLFFPHSKRWSSAPFLADLISERFSSFFPFFFPLLRLTLALHRIRVVLTLSPFSFCPNDGSTVVIIFSRGPDDRDWRGMLLFFSPVKPSNQILLFLHFFLLFPFFLPFPGDQTQTRCPIPHPERRSGDDPPFFPFPVQSNRRHAEIQCASVPFLSFPFPAKVSPTTFLMPFTVDYNLSPPPGFLPNHYPLRVTNDFAFSPPPLSRLSPSRPLRLRPVSPSAFSPPFLQATWFHRQERFIGFSFFLSFFFPPCSKTATVTFFFNSMVQVVKLGFIRAPLFFLPTPCDKVGEEVCFFFFPPPLPPSLCHESSHLFFLANFAFSPPASL